MYTRAYIDMTVKTNWARIIQQSLSRPCISRRKRGTHVMPKKESVRIFERIYQYFTKKCDVNRTREGNYFLRVFGQLLIQTTTNRYEVKYPQISICATLS